MSNQSSAIRVTPISAFADNYIWLIESLHAPGRALIVDPGDAQPVLAVLQARALRVAGILLTHHHPDHVGGVEALRAGAAVPVYGPQDARMPACTIFVGDRSQVEFPEMRLAFECWHLPGHTLTHVGYIGHGALFCGDTLFSAGCGRLFEGSPEQMNTSLSRLAALPPETGVYCAHEYTLANLRFALAVEPANETMRHYDETAAERRARGAPTLPSTIAPYGGVNPFLRCDRPTVRHAAEAHAGRPLGRDAEVFAVLRSWKDGFR